MILNIKQPPKLSGRLKRGTPRPTRKIPTPERVLMEIGVMKTGLGSYGRGTLLHVSMVIMPPRSNRARRTVTKGTRGSRNSNRLTRNVSLLSISRSGVEQGNSRREWRALSQRPKIESFHKGTCLDSTLVVVCTKGEITMHGAIWQIPPC